MKTKNGKAKKRFVCPRQQKPDKRAISIKGQWKAVELDPSLFSEEGLEGLVCFEELKSYRLIDPEKAAAQAERALKQEEKKAKKRKVDEEEEAGNESTAEPAKKKKKKKKKRKAAVEQTGDDNVPPEEEKQETEVSTEEGGGDDEVVNDDAPKDSAPVSDVKEKSKKKNKNKKKKSKQQTEESAEPEKPPIVEPLSVEKCPVDEKSTRAEIPKPTKKQVKNWSNAALSGSDDKNADVSAWKDLFVPPPVLKALSSLGFGSPTPIQALTLPPAIRDRMDILGAAETGSGKTLAFGIPMIHSILEWKNGSKETTDNSSEPSETVESLYLPPVNKPTLDTEQDEGMEASEQEDGDDEDQIQEDTGEEKDEDEQLESSNVVLDFKEKDAGGHSQPLLGLVLTPTRELAVQVKHHIDAIAKFTGIKTAIVVGGMAQEKQRRLLKRRPEIIIATPGRLWDLIKERHPHLLSLRQLKCLVIDEADRMAERGHFAELDNLLEMLNGTHFNPTRQMFVFSATLTMTHSLPSRLLQKKNVEQRNKLEVLMEKVGIKSKPKVIDLTRKEATVETLTETQIQCQKEDKDLYLYYFLLQYPGRTMVFANSIDCIKRLNSLLVILDCTSLPLHANMHQKQRLKNLERFAAKESCVLLTTDVAARGLDIPNVQHVIHYQVPRASETYVHRSGRTARAAREGLSLLLVGPDEVMNLKKIYKTLGKDEELPMFPVETKCMQAIEERVNLARSIEKIEYFNSREKQHNSWFKQAAEALEVDLDEELLLGREKDENADREQQKQVKGMKKRLKQLISQPIFKYMLKTKYPTQMGKLLLPSAPLSKKESALTSVSVDSRRQKLKKSVKPQKRKQKKAKQQ